MTLSAVRRSRLLGAGLVVLVCVVAFATLSLTAQQPADLFRNVSFREIGSTHRGGRFVDFAVVEATPRIFYAANATGGLWKTTNGGVAFTQVFDSPTAASIGAVALAQSAPDTIYVGTGEANNSRSSYYGDGVYKSTNGGQTWTHIGLKDSQHIGRIIVHPDDANTVYVAALGKLYSDNEERGVYKSVDGGTTWTKSLAVKNGARDVGVVDLAMDPKNPAGALRRGLRQGPQAMDVCRGRSGQRHLQDGGRRQDMDAPHRRPAGRRARPHRPVGLPLESDDGLRGHRERRSARGGQAQALRRGFGAEGGSPSQLFRTDDAGKTWRQVTPPLSLSGGAAAARGRRWRTVAAAAVAASIWATPATTTRRCAWIRTIAKRCTC